MSSQQLKYLFSPFRIKSMELKNRLVMSAMGNRLVGDEGLFTERARDYYAARARGGVGLVMSQSSAIDRGGMSHRKAFAVYDDKFLPGMAELASTIHEGGAKVCLQMHHTGPTGSSTVFGIQPVAASAVRQPESWAEEGKETPRSLPKSEIAHLVECFASAAGRAKKTGFDAVEIHASHRYLLNSFLSPAWNRREDEYGGDLKGRARFLLEIIKAVRETVGQDYPVLCKVNGIEFDVDGIKLEQTVQLAPMLQDAGVDAIDISSMPFATPFLVPGSRIFMAAAIKKVVTIPVMAVGRITPRLGDQFIRQGKADLIVIGRGIIADPEIANKAAEGRLEDIRPCVGCENCRKRNIAVQGKVIVDPYLICTINAAAGKEREMAIHPTDKPKKVMVIGGGPGGMEAARVAAQRGHQVVLYEKENRLGGSLTLAGLINENYANLAKYLALQLRKAGVKVQLGKEVTPALIDTLKPDVLIVAGGAIPLPPKIAGIDNDIVVNAANIKAMMSGHPEKSTSMSWHSMMWQIGGTVFSMPFGPPLIKRMVRQGMPFGKRVTVIGDGLAGCEMADFLAETGKEVTLIELPESLLDGIMPRPMNSLRLFFLDRLAKRKATVLTGVKFERITGKGLVITNKEGKTQTIPADNIVVTAGSRPNTDLAEALKGKTPEVHVIGDCADPRGILEAIHDAYEIAYKM